MVWKPLLQHAVTLTEPSHLLLPRNMVAWPAGVTDNSLRSTTGKIIGCSMEWYHTQSITHNTEGFFQVLDLAHGPVFGTCCAVA